MNNYGLYLEDGLPQNIMDGMKNWKEKYNTKESENVLTEVYDKIFKQRIVELELTYEQLKQKELVENNRF